MDRRCFLGNQFCGMQCGTLIATSIGHLETLLHKTETVSINFGLKINRTKTSYVYLGAFVTNSEGYIDEIKRCMVISNSAMDKMKRILKNRNIT